jgi:hypothetical protein
MRVGDRTPLSLLSLSGKVVIVRFACNQEDTHASNMEHLLLHIKPLILRVSGCLYIGIIRACRVCPSHVEVCQNHGRGTSKRKKKSNYSTIC